MLNRYPDPRDVEIGYFELSTHLLALDAVSRGLPVRWLSRAYFETEIGGRKTAFWCTRSEANSAVAVKAATRKDMTARILTANGVSIAKGSTFRDRDKALGYARKIGYPVVTKPLSGTKGKGITVGVRSDDEFIRAWGVAQGGYGGRRVLVERVFEGTEARFLVVGDRCVGVVKRIPPNVVGDGASTVEKLIADKNQERMKNPHLRSRLIHLDPHRIDTIQSAGYALSDVLPEGLSLEIDRKGGFSTGADSHEMWEETHETFLQVAVDATRAFPGLGIAGVDILATDFSRSASSRNHIVVEVNSMPGLGAHHFPWIGEPKNAAGAILDFFGAPESHDKAVAFRNRVAASLRRQSRS